MVRFLIRVAVAALLAASVALAQAPQQVGPIDYRNLGTATITVPGGSPRAIIDHLAERVNVKNFQAKGDAVGFNDAVMAAGSDVLSSASATFTNADIGKVITVTGTGTGGASQVGTITGVTDPHTITTSFTSVFAVPWQYGISYINSATGTGYVPGDTFSPIGGTTVTTPGVGTITQTQVVSAAVNAGGSGGVNGPCAVTGTTGKTSNGTFFAASGTVTGGILAGALAVTVPAVYYTNPTAISAEPVTSNCGLVGTTVALGMGVFHTSADVGGHYAALPTGVVATTTPGAGTGFTVTANGQQGGGQYTYGTDDSAAINRAIIQANSKISASQQTLVYAPSGAYLLSGTALTNLIRNGGFVGDGSLKTLLYATSSYSGDVLAWSGGSWAGDGASTLQTMAVSINTIGPVIRGFTIIGDRRAPAQQNGIVLYDAIDGLVLDDVEVRNMRGRCFYAGATKLTATALLRETHTFGSLRCWYTGDANTPSVEITATGGIGSNEVDIGAIDIYAPYGPGFLLRNGATGPSRDIKIDNIRVEGLETGPVNTLAGHSIQVGDDTTQTGPVNNITFSHTESISVYQGYAGFRLTGGAAVLSPYGIMVTDGHIQGGTPLGKGLEIDAGRNNFFRFCTNSAWDAQVTIGSSTTVGGYNIIDTCNNPFTAVIDPTSANNYFLPAYMNSGPLVYAISANTNPAVPSNNTTYGNNAGLAITTGLSNTCYGSNACKSVTTGSSVTAMGAGALQFATGSNTTAFGENAGLYVAASISNSIFGAGAMQGVTGNRLSGVGNNSAFGLGSLANLQGSANNNTAYGANAGKLATTPIRTTVLGSNVGSTTFATGTDVILIGTSSNTDTPAAGSSNIINIGGLWYGNTGSLAAPSTFTCGTTPSVDAHANNRSGTITAGSGTVTSCAMTFAGTGYTTWNHCRVFPQSAIASFAYSYTLTGITITGTSLTSFKFDYDCDGY